MRCRTRPSNFNVELNLKFNGRTQPWELEVELNLHKLEVRLDISFDGRTRHGKYKVEVDHSVKVEVDQVCGRIQYDMQHNHEEN